MHLPDESGPSKESVMPTKYHLFPSRPHGLLYERIATGDPRPLKEWRQYAKGNGDTVVAHATRVAARLAAAELIRTVYLHPYSPGKEIFRVQLFDLQHSIDNKARLGYRLQINQNTSAKSKYETIFEGTDFGWSPLHAIDSDECMKSVCTFLTLRPGDTDDEYFKDYTKTQLDYCDQHAESLSIEVLNRFGE